MKLVQNFMLFLPVPLACSLGEEGVHSGAGTITATLPPRPTVRAPSHRVAPALPNHRACWVQENPRLVRITDLSNGNYFIHQSRPSYSLVPLVSAVTRVDRYSSRAHKKRTFDTFLFFRAVFRILFYSLTFCTYIHVHACKHTSKSGTGHHAQL